MSNQNKSDFNDISVSNGEPDKKGSFWIWFVLNVLAGFMCLIIELLVEFVTNNSDGSFWDRVWNVINSYSYRGGFASVSIAYILGALGLFFNSLFVDNRPLSNKMKWMLVITVLLFVFDAVYYTIVQCCPSKVIIHHFHWNIVIIVLTVSSFVTSLLVFRLTSKNSNKEK